MKRGVINSWTPPDQVPSNHERRHQDWPKVLLSWLTECCEKRKKVGKNILSITASSCQYSRVVARSFVRDGRKGSWTKPVHQTGRSIKPLAVVGSCNHHPFQRVSHLPILLERVNSSWEVDCWQSISILRIKTLLLLQPHNNTNAILAPTQGLYLYIPSDAIGTQVDTIASPTPFFFSSH